ncbi:MAG TPA: helix-turn-helix transcriptional regulator [Acidimicrobiales bacterium]|nr:helix-turn-helix transcriptional regulator [Acidimicrobiales bacterium]
MSDSGLGTYIRGKREATTPAAVGLPTGPRRRTPGLRRTELATLAGISVEYLTRIEQGRDRHPSAPVLGALADALLLAPDERSYLRLTAKAAAGETFDPCPGDRPPSHEVRPTVRAVLDRLEPAPALVCNHATDILAHTAGYDRLARPLGILDGERPNLVRYLFADPRARQAFPDWDQVADAHLSALRSAFSPTSAHLRAITDELTVLAGAPLTHRLTAVPGPERRTGAERLAHPEVGELRLLYETLHLDGQRLVVYLPADDTAAAALDQLTGLRPGALRSVTA